MFLLFYKFVYQKQKPLKFRFLFSKKSSFATNAGSRIFAYRDKRTERLEELNRTLQQAHFAEKNAERTDCHDAGLVGDHFGVLKLTN